MSLRESILQAFELPVPERGEAARHLAMQHGPLVLAFIGDTIFDLYTRTLLVAQSGATAHTLHLRASERVCAAAQAKAAARIRPLLNEQEEAVFKRGRNAHMGTVPKNASIADYRAATGLEAVMGYLYIAGEDARLNELMKLALEV